VVYLSEENNKYSLKLISLDEAPDSSVVLLANDEIFSYTRPRIDGNIVVWNGDQSIHTYNIVTGEEAEIARLVDGLVFDPDIEGDVIVYGKRENSDGAEPFKNVYSMNAFNLTLSEGQAISEYLGGDSALEWPTLSNGTVSWTNRAAHSDFKAFRVQYVDLPWIAD
jgi:hypothetical protein